METHLRLALTGLVTITLSVGIAGAATDACAQAPQIAPNGTWVAGQPQIAPNGTYVGGLPQIADCDRGDAKDSSGFLVHGYCVGFIKGIADAMNDNPLNGFKACLPPGLIVTQITGIVRQFLNAHPESLHFAASGLVALSLATAFPCQK